jgi:hypothetical protein
MFNLLIGVLFAISVGIVWMVLKLGSKRAAFASIVASFFVATYLSNAYLYPEYLGWRFESDIKQQPLFSLIEKHHPNEYNAFLKKVKQSFRIDPSQDMVSIYSAELINNVFYQHLETTPNDYIDLYLKATIDLYRHLNGLDPRAVVNLENGNGSIKFDINALWEDKDFRALLNHLLDTKRHVIEASINTPQPSPNPQQAEQLLKEVLTSLENKYGEKTVRSVFTAQFKDIPVNQVAQIIIEFYTDILGQGKDNAGTVIRYIASLKAKAAEEQQKLPMHS